MEDVTTYSSLVARNIHLSVSQMNAITSILQGHDMIVCLPTGHGYAASRRSRIANERMRTNIFIPSCIISLIFDKRTGEILLRM